MCTIYLISIYTIVITSIYKSKTVIDSGILFIHLKLYTNGNYYFSKQNEAVNGDC